MRDVVVYDSGIVLFSWWQEVTAEFNMASIWQGMQFMLLGDLVMLAVVS